MTREAQRFLGLKDSKGCWEGSTAEPQPPRDVYICISGNGSYVTLRWKKDAADVTKDLEVGRLSLVIHVAQQDHKDL